MTKEEFSKFVDVMKHIDGAKGDGLFICIAELDEGFGCSTRGYVRDIIEHAIKLIVSSTERVIDKETKIFYIRAAAEKLNICAELMKLEVKEKAPNAARAAQGAEK